jgi:TAZ zinc finger
VQIVSFLCPITLGVVIANFTWLHVSQAEVSRSASSDDWSRPPTAESGSELARSHIPNVVSVANMDTSFAGSLLAHGPLRSVEDFLVKSVESVLSSMNEDSTKGTSVASEANTSHYSPLLSNIAIAPCGNSGNDGPESHMTVSQDSSSSGTRESLGKRGRDDDSIIDSTCNPKADSDCGSISAPRRRKLSQIVPYPRRPREAEYNCSICTHAYQLTVNENPWWAVYSHECPQCHQIQIPRLDIGSAVNAIECDPNVVALYGEGVDDSGDEGESFLESDNEDNGGDDMTVDNGSGDTRSHCFAAGNGALDVITNLDDRTVTDDGRESEVEADIKVFDGQGLLAQEEASKLLVLMCHARTCNSVHASPKHAEICRSTKFLMLHLRDCSGYDLGGKCCVFPWCLPCKRMLQHLTHCYDPSTCAVCNPW